jgi:hypothetical protein
MEWVIAKSNSCLASIESLFPNKAHLGKVYATMIALFAYLIMLCTKSSKGILTSKQSVHHHGRPRLYRDLHFLLHDQRD